MRKPENDSKIRLDLLETNNPFFYICVDDLHLKAVAPGQERTTAVVVGKGSPGKLVEGIKGERRA